MQPAPVVFIISLTMEPKTNQLKKTKGKHLSAKPSQDFEVILRVFGETDFDVQRASLQQRHVPMEIIVKRVPEHGDCPQAAQP